MTCKTVFEFNCGNLAERQNRTQTKQISGPHELYRILATPGVEVVNLLFASDSVVWVSCRYIAEKRVPSMRHTNVACGGLIHWYI